MKALINTILLVTGSMVFASAQTPQYFWSDYSGPSTPTLLYPWSTATHDKIQCIYYPTNFPTAPSGNVSSLYVRIGNPPYPKSTYSIFPNFSVRMGWSNDSAFFPINILASSPLDTFSFFTGLTTVFSSPSFVINGTDTLAKWVKIPLIPNSFYYNRSRNTAEGKYLIVEFRFDGSPPQHGFWAMSSVTTSVKRQLYDHISNVTSTDGHDMPIDFGFDIGTPVGVDEAQLGNTLSIFPNPSREGRFNISFDAKQSIKEVNLTVRSMTGAEVYNQHYNNTGTHFDKDLNMDNNASGMYFVEVQADGERVVRKIVVQ